MKDLLVQGYTDCLDGLEPQSLEQEYLEGYWCELVNQEYFESIYN